MKRTSLLLASLLALVSLNVAAEVYVIRDKNGKVIGYSDQPPPDNKTEVRRLTDNRVDGQQMSFEMQRAADMAPVTLYTTPDCKAPCDDARKLLGQRKIPFAEQSVTKPDQLDALKQLLGKDKPQVPTLVVGRQPTEGFAAQTWNSALDVAGYPKAAR